MMKGVKLLPKTNEVKNIKSSDTVENLKLNVKIIGFQR